MIPLEEHSLTMPSPHRPVRKKPPLGMRAKDHAKHVAVSAASRLNDLFGCRAGQTFGILMYHRVVDTVPGIEPPTWNVTPRDFEEQLSGLLESGYQPWPLRQVIEYRNLGKPIPPQTFIVTFDDGHEGIYLNAWPILRRLNVPTTIFLATAFLDSQEPFPFDDWSGAGSPLTPIETWRPLSSAQCRELVSDGLIELGAHTHTHQDFDGRAEDFHTDLATNLRELNNLYEITNPALAFPFGRVDRELMHAAQECSVSCALTTLATTVDHQESPFGWGRFQVESWDTSKTLAAKLGGWYSWAPQLRRRVFGWKGHVRRATQLKPGDAVEWVQVVCGHKTVHRAAISLIDQMVVSGTSFFTVLLLGRACLPEELGVYSVGFSLLLAILAIPRALVWTPYTTLFPTLSEDDARQYSGSMLAHLFLLGVTLALGVSAFGALVWKFGAAQNLGVMFMFLGPVLLLAPLREHIRRVCFSRLEVEQALAVDVAVSLAQIGGMLSLLSKGLLNASTAYVVMGVSCLPLIIVWLSVNHQKFSLRSDRIAADFWKNWGLGRWLFATAFVASANDLLYVWGLSWLHGTTAVGILSAASGVILLSNPLSLAFGNFFGPHAAHVYVRDGIAKLYRQVMTTWMAMAAMMMLISVAMGLWGASLLTLMFGEKYAGQGNVIFALALGQFGEVAEIPFAIGLLAVGRGSSLLRAYICRLAISVTLGVWFIHQFDATGVGYGRAISNFVMVAMEWWVLRKLALTEGAKS